MYFIYKMFYYHHGYRQALALKRAKLLYWDMTLLLNGRLLYDFSGNECILHRNDIILVPPGTVKERFYSSGTLEYISFNFTLSPDTELNLPLYMPNSLTPIMRHAAGLCRDEFLVHDGYSEEQVTLIANFILYELMRNQSTLHYSPHTNIMLKIIRERIYEPLSLSDVAASANLSPSYAANLFKKETGSTIVDYIRKQKMLLARDMILAGESSLNEIAEKLGYTNYSYFSMQFKKYYNCAPSFFKVHSLL